MNRTESPLTTDSLAGRIKAFIDGNPQNRLEHIDGSPIFDEPRVGVADGDDPLFTEYKTLIGPFHAAPRELLALALAEASNDVDSSLDRVAVVSWVLPITEATRSSNRGPRSSPSRRWAHTRTHEVEVTGCGLCQTDVPCEDCTPDRLLASPTDTSDRDGVSLPGISSSIDEILRPL